MPETITFHTPYLRYQIQIVPEAIQPQANGQFTTVPAKLIAFDERGIYVTSDENEIKKLRESNAYREGIISEITPEDKAAISDARQPTVRGPINSRTINQEAGVTEKSEQKMLKEGITVCDVPGCGKTFTKDMAGRRLRMHKQWHKKKDAMDTKKLEEK